MLLSLAACGATGGSGTTESQPSLGPSSSWVEGDNPNTAPDSNVDFWGPEGCGLHRLVDSAAVVLAHPAPVQTNAFSDEQTVAFDIEISKVLWSRADVSLPAGSSITVTVYADFANSPGTLTGTVVEALWPDRATRTDHPVRLVFDGYGRSEFGLTGLPLDSNYQSAGDVECKFTEHFAELARRLDRTADLSLYIDYAAEIEQYGLCFYIASNETSSSRTCPNPIDEIADRVSRSLPEPTIVTADEAWRNSDPANRWIAFADVPSEIVDKLVLLGVHVEFKGTPRNAIYTMRCRLGVGASFGPQGVSPVFPVATCKDSPLEVLVGDGSKGDTVIGTIDPSSFDIQNGMAIVIDFETAPISMSTRALKPGELETITGFDAATIEDLRERYSTPSTAPSTGG